MTNRYRWILASLLLATPLCSGCEEPKKRPAKDTPAATRTESASTVKDANAVAGEAAKAESSSTTDSIANERKESSSATSDNQSTNDSSSAPPVPANAPSTSATDRSNPAAPPSTAQPAQGTKQSVTLGDPSLTAGIPGSGPVTLADVEQWLANPENHVELDVVLPMGLSAGAQAISGIDKNPLTRAKIELGRQLYFDGRLAADNQTSCASCHHPDEGFAKHTQFGVGIRGQQGGRNSPVSYNRIVSGAQFWDGRADSLEAQAVGPIQNPIEMGNTHENCVQTLKNIPGYAKQFERVFGDGVTIENVGKAIASFERTIVTGPSAYDYFADLERYLSQDEDDLKADADLWAKFQAARQAAAAKPISDAAKRGRDLFFGQKANCTACHVGANFTDEKYHNLGVGMDKENPDIGRQEVTKDEKDRGAFKTPTTRNVALTAPYMHDGSQKTLAEVVAWYNKGGHPNPNLSDKIKKLDLSEQDQADLVAFMEACTGDFPQVNQARLPE